MEKIYNLYTISAHLKTFVDPCNPSLQH